MKAEKFTAHNSHWLAMVKNKALETSLLSLPDSAYEAMPRYDLNQSLSVLNAGKNQDHCHISSNIRFKFFNDCWDKLQPEYL